MFSAFKKLTTRPEGNGGGTSPANVQSMSSNLQRKFAKGCNYNMKIVIRGDRNTGKSCLLARLQGKPFIENYVPTDEIQVASINWSYKNTEDIVKVEVWDIVDVAKKRKKLSGLKVSGDVEEYEPGLDAEFIDVYKGTHGVIFLLDITKPWTMDYVRKESGLVPSHIPILILANFTDMGHHRQVTQLQVADFVENFKREGSEIAEARWGECSLRNGFGLKFLHRFFNVPFLTLQRQSLLQQLEINKRDIIATQEELDVYMESDEANYQMFSDQLTNKRRAIAEQAAPAPSASIVAGQPSNVIDLKSSSSFAPSSSQIPFSNKKVVSSTDSSKTVSNPQSSSVNPSKNVDVDTFVPDDGDFNNFLEESDISKEKTPTSAAANTVDSSDEEEGGNPMVAKYADEVDVDTYDQVVDINLVKSDSEDSDNETSSIKQMQSDIALNDANYNKHDIKSVDNLEDFLNDVDDCDRSVQSVHDDYETL